MKKYLKALLEPAPIGLVLIILFVYVFYTSGVVVFLGEGLSEAVLLLTVFVVIPYAMFKYGQKIDRDAENKELLRIDRDFYKREYEYELSKKRKRRKKTKKRYKKYKWWLNIALKEN